MVSEAANGEREESVLRSNPYICPERYSGESIIGAGFYINFSLSKQGDYINWAFLVSICSPLNLKAVISVIYISFCMCVSISLSCGIRLAFFPLSFPPSYYILMRQHLVSYFINEFSICTMNMTTCILLSLMMWKN